MAFTIIIVIFSIIALMVLHEFGHFIVAKLFGVKVEEFGVGLPPRLFGKKIGQTVYSLNLIPFGAFVRIPDVDGEKKEDNKGNYKKLSNIPVWQRALIVLAGVISFWIIGAVLLSIVFGLGASQAISDEETGLLANPRVLITAVSSNSPAEAAGIKPGDMIRELKADNQRFSVDKIKEVLEFTEKHKGEEMILVLERGKEFFEASLIPRVSPPEGEGAIGIVLTRTAEKSYPFFQAVAKGAEATVSLTIAITASLVDVLISLVRGQGLPQGVQFVGPIGIGSLATQAAQVGLSYFLQFIAVIAVYLAIFNILPIPALDGGKLLFLGIEKIKGKPVKQKIEQNITAAFFILLILLIILVTIKDITRLL